MRGAGRLAVLLVAVVAVVAIAVPPARAVAVDDQQLDDPAKEARARDIMKGLRCLVCQNQSIEDSNAALARDLRRIVRDRIALGDADEDVRAYVVARYGDWVLLKPPFKLGTLLLWIGPLLLAVAGLLSMILGVRFKRRGRPESETPLSEDERRRLDAVLSEEDAAQNGT